MITCKNCNDAYNGNFCPACGQKAATHEIDGKYIMHEIPHAIFHVDKGILYTIGQLSTRPGKTVLEYIRGRRVKHYSPIAYILILSAIFLLVNKFTTVFTGVDYTRVNNEVQEKIEHLTGLIFLTLTPVFALFYTLFFYKKTGFNYWQMLVANTFFIGHVIFVLIVLQLLLAPLQSLLPKWAQGGIVMWSLVLYQLLASAQLLWSFYNNKLLLVLKIITAIVLSQVVSLFIFIGYVAGTQYILAGVHH
jgi:hypothetical protein